MIMCVFNVFAHAKHQTDCFTNIKRDPLTDFITNHMHGATTDDVTTIEPRREKTGFLHMRKRRRTSASR